MTFTREELMLIHECLQRRAEELRPFDVRGKYEQTVSLKKRIRTELHKDEGPITVRCPASIQQV